MNTKQKARLYFSRTFSPVAFLAIVLVTMRPTELPAANAVGPGTVTQWGSGSSQPFIVSLPTGVTASAIAAGEFHNVAITTDGLYEWAAGAPSPAKVTLPPSVTAIYAVAAGTDFSLALTDDGVYAWGGNGSGELGNGTTTDSAVPVKVLFPPTVTAVAAIAAGTYPCMAITDDGLYTWGSNGGGQLGDGTVTTRTLPVKVTFPLPGTTPLAVAGGGFHSLAITDKGLYAWGNNTFGQLGDASTTTRLTPTAVVFQAKLAPTSVTAIAAGTWHSLGIGDNAAYGWGYNGNGELGDGTGATRLTPVKVVYAKKTPAIVTAIAAGDMHSLAITDDGGLFAWGNNSNGQLGMNGGTRLSATRVSAESNVIAISAGAFDSVALH